MLFWLWMHCTSISPGVQCDATRHHPSSPAMLRAHDDAGWGGSTATGQTLLPGDQQRHGRFECDCAQCKVAYIQSQRTCS